MFEDILAGLIVSLIAFLLTFFTPKFYRLIQIKKIDKVLPISNSRIGVIVGGYTNMIPKYKHDMFVHKESVVSQNLLIELFKKYKSNLIYKIDKEFGFDNNFKLEICIGGPTVNERTKFFLTKDFEGILDNNNTIKNNEALIIYKRIKNEFGKTIKVILLLYGYEEIETYSAILYFKENFKSLIKEKFKNTDVSVLRLQTDKESGYEFAKLKSDESEKYHSK